MPRMARRNRLEERWAGYAIDAAKPWGQPGQMVYDRKRHVVAFTGLGDVPLDDPEGRFAKYVGEEQRNEMARRAMRGFLIPGWRGSAMARRSRCPLVGFRLL